MKKIMFGNSLMLLGIAIMILAGLELIYIGIMWASFLLISVGFIMAVIGFLAKTVKFPICARVGEIRNNGLNKVVLDCLLGCDNITLCLYKDL